MKITGGNKSKLKFKLFVVSSYLTAFSPLYLKFIIGSTYFSGFFIGCLCSWGINNIYNKIPKEEEKGTYHYQEKKRKKIKRLVDTLRAIENKKRSS